MHLVNEEIQEIINFFFKDVFGPNAKERVYSLLNYIQEAGKQCIELGSSERAAALACKDDIPAAFRSFLDCFGRFHQGTRHNSSVHSKTLKHWHQYILYETFEQIQTAAHNDASKYHDFLTKQGLKIRAVQSGTTPILTYLSGALGLERITLRYMLQQSQNIHLLASAFVP